jgi:hypothetical protein
MKLTNLQGLFSGPRRIAPRHCEHIGCDQATREGKAYCSDHVEQHPYVQELLSRLAERDRQDDDVARRGSKAADLEAITAQEILAHLAFHGPRTEERLCRELNVGDKTLVGYVQALKRAKLVTLAQTKRGSTLVKPSKRVAEALGEHPTEVAAPIVPGETEQVRRTG